jgi:hypothetical protein
LKSKGGSGFLSGFLYILNLFHNTIKYFKDLRNEAKNIYLKINKGRKINNLITTNTPFSIVGKKSIG